MTASPDGDMLLHMDENGRRVPPEIHRKLFIYHAMWRVTEELMLKTGSRIVFLTCLSIRQRLAVEIPRLKNEVRNGENDPEV